MYKESKVYLEIEKNRERNLCAESIVLEHGCFALGMNLIDRKMRCMIID
jgi:hypothetical protein